MVNRDGERDDNLDFNENDPDPTKEAFFSDMGDIENEIASEALELVKHALSLLDSQFYDDSIEILRQAIGLYTQINKVSEVEALNGKISEIYLLREENFKKRELETEEVFENIQGEIISEQDEENLYDKADALIVEAIEFVNNRNFDQALDTYDDAIGILKKLNKRLEIEKINELIEDCYNRKADYLRKQKASPIEEDNGGIQATENSTPELELKAKRIKAYQDAKRKENELSNQAYELIGKATEMRKIRQFDEALGLFEQSISLFKEINWLNEVKKIENIKEQVERDKEKYMLERQQIRAREEHELEDKKKQKAQLIERSTMEENLKQKAQAAKIREQIERKQEEEIFQNSLTDMIDYAEKLVREYELNLKKAINQGRIVEECAYPRVIKIYEEVRDKAKERGWKDQVSIYTNQIKIYQEKWEKDKKLRQMEAQKVQKQKFFDEGLKTKRGPAVTEIEPEKLKMLKEQKRKEIEIEKIKENLTESVKLADKMAREYEVAFKKAVKMGNLNIVSKYPEILKIYTDTRDKALEKGWKDDAAIYSSQIRKYTELAEREIKIREIEAKKNQDQKIFEDYHKAQSIKEPTVYDEKKLRKIEELAKQKQEEQLFEQEIDEIVNNAEKETREYELAIMNGQFDKKCPYLKIAEIYKNLRKKAYAKGWKDEAEIYSNQITLYHEKNQKDERLRKLEIQKVKKQQKFEESLKAPTEIKQLKLVELEALDSKNRETDEIMTQAMNLIDKAEKAVRNYEVNLKRDILSYQSPYEEVINMYVTARKLLQKIGWSEEAIKLSNTISFYESKKLKDDNLRAFELQKIEESKTTPVLVPKDDHLIQEKRIDELKKLKEVKSKESEVIFNRLTHAEKMAKDYEIKKKEGILKAESPYKEIIQIYKTAKLDFEKIGWVEQADQLVNSINYYQKKLDEVKRLRASELERAAKQEEEIKHFEKEVQEAQKVKEELSQLRIKELEEKRKRAAKYESKKERAFNFMDLAKRELKQNNFDKAIKFYKESQQIFDEINWQEGSKMTKESINAINLKKQRLEREEKLLAQKKLEKIRNEAQLEEQITKAKDLHDLQQEQRRRELLAIQEEKEREKEISDKAYLLLEAGTKLKDDKRFEEAYEKYIMGRDLFKKIGWEHEVSRINNDLMITLKKEMKQTEKLKAYQQKKVEEKKELEELLKEAEENQKELDHIRKEEKKKQREKLIQKERDKANQIIKNLKYNEGILALRKVIEKIENTDQDKMIKEMNKQIEVLENASQVPIITKADLDRDENFDKFRLAYQALDKAQISLSNNLFMKAITELNEALFNLTETKIGKRYILEIEDKINIYKRELDIKKTPEPEVKKVSPKLDEEDLRAKIAKRREERRKRINDL